MSPDNAAHLRPAWVEIDLDAVRANTALARRLAGGTKLYAAVKGDGYGGGAIEIGQAALEGGADALAVGSPADALALRRHGLRCPILLHACSLPEDAADRPGPVRAAVLPIGFGEGFPYLPPCHEVLVHGRRAPVPSRRDIEHTVIDVTGIRDVRIGSEAVLLGR